MSNENLPTSLENWAREITQTYGTDILVIGLGAEGFLLSVRTDNFMERIPAAQTRPVVNTIGAGDAWISGFLHAYVESSDRYDSIQKAVVFASYKIGAKGASEGFLSRDELDDLYQNTYKSGIDASDGGGVAA